MSTIEKNDWKLLYQNDQLIKAQEDKVAFVGFSESSPSFPPTFKLESGEGNTAYSKKRIPAYCDRILWKSLRVSTSSCFPDYLQAEEDKLKNVSFNYCPEITTSDHYPVSATFKVKIVPELVPDPFAPRQQCKIHLSHLYVHENTPADPNIERNLQLIFMSSILPKEVTLSVPKQVLFRITVTEHFRILKQRRKFVQRYSLLI